MKVVIETTKGEKVEMWCEEHDPHPNRHEIDYRERKNLEPIEYMTYMKIGDNVYEFDSLEVNNVFNALFPRGDISRELGIM